MTLLTRNQVLVTAGGDALMKYGTMTRRLGSQTRGGEGLAETFTRSGVALALGSDGSFLKSQGGAPRVQWGLDPVTALSRPYLLIEGNGATNQVEQSTALATSPWGFPSSHLTATNNAAADPFRGTAATLLVPDTFSTALHNIVQTVTIASGENLAISGFFKAGAYSGLQMMSVDGAGTNGFWVAVDLAAGTIVRTFTAGAGTYNGSFIVPIGGGWYWVGAWGQNNGGDTTTQYQLRVFQTGTQAQNTTAYAGAGGTTGLYAWCAGLERNGSTATPPTSPIPTGASTGSRNAETFTIPFNVSPRPLAVYAKFVELGMAVIGGAGGFPNAMYIGQVSSSPPAQFLTIGAAGQPYYDTDHGNPQFTEVSSVPGTPYRPVWGQQMETLSLMFADGSVQYWESLNGNTDQSGPRSGANPNGIGPLWGNQPAIVIGSGGPVGLVSLKAIDNTNGAIATLAQARAVPV